MLRVPGDRKEAQRIMTYDLMYSTLKDMIELYQLPVPLLFQCQGIDRLCKTFFNRCDQVRGCFNFLRLILHFSY